MVLVIIDAILMVAMKKISTANGINVVMVNNSHNELVNVNY